MQMDIHIQKSVKAGQQVFHLDVQWQVETQRLVIMGPSGAGKSLTLQALAGLLTPDSGHIRLGGITLFDADRGVRLSPQVRQCAFLFQDYALFPHLTVRQNIGFGLARGWRNPSRHHHVAVVDEWLETFRLTGVAGQYPDQLSGGQAQRTALARALIARPRALLLDEPFAALDSALRTHMRGELDALQRRLQIPMILITHDPDDAAVLGEQVLYLQGGKIQGSALCPAASGQPVRVA